MKRKTCIALLALSSGLMIVFAAEADKCTEKFEACKVTCGHQKAQCVARGVPQEACDNRMKGCEADCSKDLKKCQEKAGIKPTPSPKPAPKK